MLYGRAGQHTDVDIIRHMHFTSWITTATNTHWKYTLLIAFPATNVTHTVTNITLYVDCMSCCYIAGIISLYW